MPDERTLADVQTRRAWVFAVSLLAAAVVSLTVIAVDAQGLDTTASLLGAAAVAVAFLLVSPVGLNVRLGRQRHVVDVDELPLLVGLVLLPTGPLLLGFALGTLLRYLPSRRLPVVKRAFNVAVSLAGLAVAVLVFAPLAGPAPRATTPGTWLAVMVACTAYAAVTAVCSIAVMRLVGAAADGWPLLRVTVVASWLNGVVALVAVILVQANPVAIWMLVVLALAVVVGYRAYDEMQRRHDELAKLTAFNERMVQQRSVEQVALDVLDEVRTVMHVELAELVVYGEEPWRLVSRGTAAPIREDDITRSFALRAAALSFETPVLLPRGSRRAEDRRVLTSLEFRDALVVPLRHVGATVGSLLVANRIGDSDTFGQGDADLLTAMASQSYAALQAGRTAARLAAEEQRIARTSTQDPLTGLANRRSIDASLVRLLQARGQGAVLLVDLANFKRVNDTLGHDVGDELLIETSRRLRSALSGRALLGRVGADVFLVCLGTADEQVVQRTIEHLRSVVAVPVGLGELAVDVNVAVGVALAPGHGDDPSMLLRHAEVALGEAKGTPGGVVVYVPERDASAPWRLMVAGALRQAIEEREIGCHYQPKVDLRTGAVRGVEALARWSHPQRGEVTPTEFVAVAEENDLVEQLTGVVLSTALAQAASWAAAGHRVPVSVNISAKGLNERLVQQVAQLLETHRVVPGMLTLELTETCMMEDAGRTAEIFAALAGLGVQLSIDDFGTGYSSLSYLARLPVDEIKIDRSFVTEMREEQAAEAVVTATIALALQLGCEVVAEGVGDAEAAQLLARLGCATGQGFYWSKPLGAAAATAWLDEHDPVPRPSVQPR